MMITVGPGTGSGIIMMIDIGIAVDHPASGSV
jgi:hypothetical protein